MSRAWYQLALAPSEGAGGRGDIILVAAPGDHLGEAVAAAEKAHAKRVVVGARLCSAPPLGESVGRSRNVVEQKAEVPLSPSAFRWPAGLLPELSALEEGPPGGAGASEEAPSGRERAAPRGSPRTGYVVFQEAGRGAAPQGQGGPGLHVIEAQVGGAALAETFLGWVERLPAADNLEVRLLHHFEDAGTTEVWLTPRVVVKQVLRFLDAQDRELIDNGFVELAIYLRKEQSTLRLTEHKTLEWTSYDLASIARSEKALAELGIPKLEALVRAAELPHFHLRPAGTKDRAGLSKLLGKLRMRVVDRLDKLGHSLPAQSAAK